MTPGPNELKAALQRLIDGNAGEADRDAIRTALNTGILVTGEQAVAIGGDASDVIITKGDPRAWRPRRRRHCARQSGECLLHSEVEPPRHTVL